MNQETKIKSFTDLYAWQKGHAFVVKLYEATGTFPDSENFGLTSQLRRAGFSITSNIAEGFGRRTVADRSHFYDMARASLAETQSQLLLARDINYLSTDKFNGLFELSTEVHKLMTGLINATRKNNSNS